MLGALLESRPRALSKAEIRDRLWPQTFVTEATLASVVSELRAALADDAKDPRYVRTVHGHGYAFSGIVSADEPTAAPVRRSRRGAVLWVAAGLAFLAVVGALAWNARRGAPGLATSSGPLRLAVLPLQDLSGDPDRAYAVDGLTDALVTRLAESGLSIVSRTSALRFRQSTRPRPEIAKELGADWLVEGSARRSADKMVLVVRIVDARADRSLWTRTYEAALVETSQLPARIARDVAEASRVVLTPERQARLASTRPVDPEAYDLYLRGRYQLGRGSLESNRKAIELFQEALAKDPRDAPAYAYLAHAYNQLGSVWAGEPPRPMRALATAAAGKALEIDPDLAEAHTFLGIVWLYDWEFAGAERELLRAIELDPSAADAHTAYATYLSARGRHDESLVEARKGEALDPLNVRARRYVGYVLFQARRYDEAISVLQAVSAAEPKDWFTRWFLGWALTWRGRHQEAVAELEQAVALSYRAPVTMGALAETLVRAGREPEARALLAELQETHGRRYVSPAAFVVAHVALGQREQALEWLERGADERIYFMVFVNNLESLDPLRGDPRFRALVKRIGLADAP